MALFGKLFGKPAEAQVPAERMDVAGKAVDARLDAAQAASSKGVMARMKSLMGAVKEKTREVLMYDVGQGAKEAAAFVKSDAAATVRDIKTLGRKALDVGNTDLGAYARRGAMAAGLAGAMASPLSALDETASAPMAADSGAKVELVSAPAAASPEIANLEAAVSLARVSADKGEPVVVAMVDKPVRATEDLGLGDLSDPAADPAFRLTAELARDGERVLAGNEGKPTGRPVALGAEAIKRLIQKNQLPKEFESYAQYVIEMENLRKTNPAAYEKFSKEFGVASVNLWEGRYTQEYPVCVVDEYNVGPQYDLPASKLKTDYDAASLKASLPAFFLDGYTDAYFHEQFALGNPAFTGRDGAYDPAVGQGKAESQKSLVARWTKRFDQGAGVISQGKPVDQLAAEAVNRFQVFQNRFPNVRVNCWAQEKERLAVLSWIFVSNGVTLDAKGNVVSNSPWIGKKTLADGMPGGVNPYLLQGDLSQIAISYQARRKPLRLLQTWELEVVRCKDLDGLLAAAKVALGAKQFDEYYAQVPAGFEKDSSEHKFSLLRLVMNDPEGLARAAPDAGAVRELSKRVRRELATTSRTPLVGFEDKLEALDELGLVAKPGSSERAVQEALLKGLQERVFNQALHEISPKGDMEAAVTSAEAQAARTDLAAAKADLAAEKVTAAAEKLKLEAAIAQNAAVKEASAIFDRWQAAPAAEKTKIADELNKKVEGIIKHEESRTTPDPDVLAMCRLMQSKVKQGS